jgi:UDP-3-O-[3-hydroxymyristoyl] glucosamine N-acyltransferase
MDLPKEFTLNEIAAVAGGTVGAGGDVKIKRVAISPLQAQPGDLALFFEAKLLGRLSECKASAVLIPEGTKCELPHVLVKRPALAMARMLSALQPKRFFPESGIHPSAVIDPSAEVSPDAAIGPLVVIGPKTKIGARTKIGAGCLIGGAVTIGEDCLFHQGALVADYVRIGNRVTLQQGASIGSDGFAYATERPSNMELRMSGVWELSDESNPHHKIPQIGTVIVEDDVEIGSSTTIDRATMGATVIGAGTKIDNLVMVAHNCRIGKEALIIAQVAIGGSCTVGDRAILAGQAAITDHLRIGKDAIIQGTAGVIGDVPDAAVVSGSPAVPVKEKFREIANLKRLPNIVKEFRAMQKKVDAMEKALLERSFDASPNK